VTPDVKVNAVDALLKAREVIFKEKLLLAKDKKEKQKSEYYLTALLPIKEVKNIPLNLLKQFKGTHPDVNIYLVDNKLFFKNNDNRKISELKHISNNLFVLEEKAQIEFLKGYINFY
jgi:hypothetical protein